MEDVYRVKFLLFYVQLNFFFVKLITTESANHGGGQFVFLV